MRTEVYDIVVIGGSLGGTQAAISAAKQGHKVVLTEETKWIGGQLTSQAVPPDEHKWIEEFGCTKSYRDYRNRVRDYYRTQLPLKESVKEMERFDPGQSSVSRIAHEPKIAYEILMSLLKPYIDKGLISLYNETKIVEVNASDEIIHDVKVRKVDGEIISLKGSYYLDGTDIGDLIKYANVSYTVGAESKEMTQEPHAAETFDSEDMQPVTWVAAIEYIEGEDHTIDKPEMYDFYQKLMTPYDQYPVLSWYGPDSSTGKAKKFGMFTNEGKGLFPLWSYRRIIYPPHFENDYYKHDVTLLNWPQNDYFLNNVFDTDDDELNRYKAKQLTLSFIYWLQTEAPKSDGTKGYKGIKLRGDLLGTDDGLAMYPYIRESRRIKAVYTVKEQEINSNYQNELPTYFDSVGVGCYHIDLHITTKSHRFFYDNSWPFEIPLGAFIPIKMKNLIPASKNIGTTHLTNGCFRLHPVEWNIGEVAGLLASECIRLNKLPIKIRNNESLLKAFQQFIENQGVEIHWPKDQVHPI